MIRKNPSGESRTIMKPAPLALVCAYLVLGFAVFSQAKPVPAPQSIEHTAVPVTYAFDYLLYLPKDYAQPATFRANFRALRPPLSFTFSTCHL